MGVVTFRKIMAASSGPVVRAYMTENRPQEIGGLSQKAYWRADMPQAVAEALGIDPFLPPQNADLDRLYEAKRADTGAPWTRHPRLISGLDIVWNAPKPVTLACQFAETEAERQMFWNIMARTNDKMMRMAAADLGWARRGSGGEEGADPGAVGWVTFQHEQARSTLQVQDRESGVTYLVDTPAPGDPHCHFHNTLFNLVATQEDRIGSFDQQRLTDARLKLWGAYANAILATELRRLGVRVGVDATGQAVVLPVVPDGAVQAFSKGRKQVQRNAKRIAAQHGEDWSSLSTERKLGLLNYAAQHERLSKEARSGLKTEGQTPRDVWDVQAEYIGWKHRTALEGAKPAELSDAERYEMAYGFAAAHLAEEFRTKAVIDRDVMLAWAARGLIGTGIKGPEDIHKVAALIEERGIASVQGGHAHLYTAMIDGRLRLTTSAQVAMERRVAELALAASQDRSKALSQEAITAAIERVGSNFTSKHGKGQEAAVRALGTGGAATFLTGCAGSGKSYLLAPLVDAYKHDGRKVYGCATGWQQADAMKSAGVDRTYAVAPLLHAIERGEFRPDENTVLIVEELSQVGVAAFLRLLELQQQTGFVMKMIGDAEQCQAVEAGNVAELLARVLPESEKPQLLTTQRQKREIEQEIANHFRNGEAEEALRKKRAMGTVQMLGGDSDEVAAQVADFLIRRRDVLLASGFTKGISACAVSNADAADLGRIVRQKLRARGELRGPDRVYEAEDQRGNKYDLPVAEGERVRLFKKTYGIVDGERGFIGSNGDIVTLERISEDGVALRDKDGRLGVVPWYRLMNPETGRLVLGHGWCQTIDSIQGATLDETVFHLRGAPGKHRAYVGESRAEWSTWTFVSEAEVFERVRSRRHIGDTAEISSEDLWTQLAEDMSRAPERLLGIDLVEAAHAGQREAMDRLAELEHRMELASRSGHDFADEHQDRLRASATARLAATAAAVRSMPAPSVAPL